MYNYYLSSLVNLLVIKSYLINHHKMQELEEQLNRKLNTCTNLDEELSRLKQVLKSRNEDVARLTSSNKLLEANLNNFYEKEAATTKVIMIMMVIVIIVMVISLSIIKVMNVPVELWE